MKFLRLAKRYQSTGPLNGIKVLDLTRVLAGPYCSMMLGDLGCLFVNSSADVIKVEHPSGDDTRKWGPPYTKPINPKDEPESAYFLGVNRNKKSITINFKTEQGLEIVKKLAQNSDVLIENYLPGKLDRLGLGYDELKKINPKLIYCSITGYGPTGPYSKRPGYDVIIEAEAGMMHITGEPDGQPVKVGVAVIDLTTGLYAKGAILAALYARSSNGKGQKIDVSLLESQVATLANIGSSYLIGGVEAKRWGTMHPSIVPYQSFPTKDGQIVVGAGNDSQYIKFCNTIKRKDLISEQHKTNALRVKNRKVLTAEISKSTRLKSTKEWLQLFKNSGIPFGPVNNIQQTFEHPQVVHREMIQTVKHATAGDIKLTGIPVKYSETKPSIRLPPPVLGEHTAQVLQELGFDNDEIQSFKDSNVI
ncbi:hypothetical protein HK103_004796 [Boothiomyces macroporosus]|uniref:Uncharacterized protein n=1 Tax=Boothiomyces macroporosus TaxID=261099 RepID=A0AAD5UIW6_9FUNG|nr:hypothetical protein HK103_004796 [Boothiomyces macroporosus]